MASAQRSARWSVSSYTLLWHLHSGCPTAAPWNTSAPFGPPP